MASQRKKLALGIDGENQTVLFHGTEFLDCRIDCQHEAVEKILEAEGDQVTESLLKMQGIIGGGIDSFSIRRSGELARGHLQPPLVMMSATRASRESPES